MRSPYITPEGKQALAAELHHRKFQERPEIVKALSAAAAEGDRSENAEYIYRKKQLRELDRRIRYLMKRLEELIEVSRLPADLSKVFFGAYVTVDDVDEQACSGESTQCAKYRIVGVDETDLSKGWISVDSPVAKALLSKTVGDEVVVRLPDGQRHLTITHVDYSNPPE